MRSKNNENFDRALITTQSVVSLQKMLVSRRWDIFYWLSPMVLYILGSIKNEITSNDFSGIDCQCM